MKIIQIKWEQFKNAVLYAGVGREKFDQLEERFIFDNVKNLHAYSGSIALVFGVLGLVSFFSNGFTHINVQLYFLTALTMLAVFLGASRAMKKGSISKGKALVLIYSFMSIMYLESIILTTQHPDQPAVTYIGVLLVLPQLFSDRPWRMVLHQSIFVLIFCLMVARTKLPEIVSIDVWNGISFLAVSAIASVILIPFRVQFQAQTIELAFMSTHDLLTGVRNRNAFETMLGDAGADRQLCCIYADLNGLHELNNLKGHKAGDEMLQAVATTLKEAFGQEATYRMGGDEFASVAENMTEQACRQTMDGLTASLEQRGYSVSFGYAGPWDSCATLQDTVNLAEQRMLQAKKAYYADAGLKQARR